MTPDRQKLALAVSGAGALLALAAMAAIFAAVLWRIATSADGATGDFISFYAAGYLVREGLGAQLYDPETIGWAQHLLFPGTFDDTIGYPLPVFVAWLFAPLSLLPFTAAFFLWMAANAVLLVGLLRIIERHLLSDVPAGVRRLFFAAAALSMPAVTTIAFGQVDLIALAGLTGSYLALRSGRERTAGLALALVLVKPHFLAGAGLLLLAQRRWRAASVLAGTGALLLLVPALLTAPETLAGNLSILASYPGSDDQLSVNAAVMANWRGFVSSATNSDQALVWLPGALAIAAGAIAVAWRRWRSARFEGASFDRAYALAVVLPLLVSPHLHTQSLVLLVLPGALALRAYLANGAAEGRQRAALTCLFAGFALLFFLPFFAIQGLSLTVFPLLGAFLAVSHRWPSAEAARATRHREAA